MKTMDDIRDKIAQMIHDVNKEDYKLADKILSFLDGGYKEKAEELLKHNMELIFEIGGLKEQMDTGFVMERDCPECSDDNKAGRYGKNINCSCKGTGKQTRPVLLTDIELRIDYSYCAQGKQWNLKQSLLNEGWEIRKGE